MANSRSAEKRVRQTKTRTSSNRIVRNRIKKARRSLDEAVAKGDTQAAQELYKEVSKAADLAAKKGTIHKNAARRFKSRAFKACSAKAAS